MAALTAKFLESVKGVKGRRLEWADDGQRGLYFRCSAGGEKSWSVRYRLPSGAQRRLTIGTFPEFSLADARKRALRELAKIGDGRDPVAEARKDRRDARIDRLTKPQDLAALWSGYEKHTAARKRPRTVAFQKWLFDRHVKPRLGALKLRELDRATIRAALREVGETAPVTANRAQALVSAVLNWGVEEELLQANPIAAMPRLFEESTRERVLRDPELKALWAALNRAGADKTITVSNRMVLALKLALLTMTRGGDIAGIHATEIDVEGRTWTIGADRHKSKRPHVVPLSSPAWTILVQLLGADTGRWAGYAFPNARCADAPMNRASMTRAMGQIVKAHGFSSVTPHDFRRTAATNIASERIGAPPHVVTALLGHTAEGPAVTAVYNRHKYAAEKRAALDAWAIALNEIVTGKNRAEGVINVAADRVT